MEPRIPVDRDQIEAFCKKWKIVEFSFFGSVLRDDFGPDSDVDVLVKFVDNPGWSLLDLVRMERELSAMFGREVDLLTKSSVEEMSNPFRRKSILSNYRTFYAN
jgi:uncharacterized protein